MLLLPPYLTEASGPGLVAYVREATREDLPVIVYNRANARFDERSAVAVARLPQVIGFKDGAGDLDLMSRIVRAVRDEVDHDSFLFFNGMPTAEVTQRAYRAIGVPLYSSAVFAFAPRIALGLLRRARGRRPGDAARRSSGPSTTRSPGCGRAAPGTPSR